MNKLRNKINIILENSSLSNTIKRQKLNKIEKDNPQALFIKTHLCSCGNMSVEVWFKTDTYEL